MVSFRHNKIPCAEPSSMINLSFSLLLFLLQHLFILQVNSYIATDDLPVNCGARGNNTFQNRIWVGDDDSKLFGLSEPQYNGKSPSMIAKALEPSFSTSVPYDTARLSNSEFTYSFHVSNGPKFVRLHFYPTSYSIPSFEPYNSLFSVKVNGFTLLKDFNASLWVPNGEKTFSLEYCVNVETGQRLNLTFFPSTTNHPNAYAFINAIEVVSMPHFLYYTNLSNYDPNQRIQLVGYSNTPYQLDDSNALETLYRVNVGQNQIPQNNDTGMFRYWEDDARYVEKQYPRSISSGFGLKLKYNGYPDYIAPASVYLTARSYGQRETSDYNVTWNFEVDTKFTCMVRLHFCEFDAAIQQIGDRVFQIFIDDTMAEERADVIEWSGGNLIPVHRDYAVLMPSRGSSKKVKLSIKLQRAPKSIQTVYRDVTLNGIEIFKISDKNNLAGPNPDPVPSPPSQLLPPVNKSSKNSNSNKTTVVIIIVTIVAVAAVVVVVISAIVLRRKRGLDKEKRENKAEGSSSLPSNLCRYFTIAEIRAATNNFDDVFIIGVGGFGNVYKGYIDGATPVAIKRLKPGSQQGAKEFLNEIEMLSKLRHVHLVSLIGYCNDGAEMILVYDFMQRGTLRDYLYGSYNNTNNQRLPWKQRLEILLGAARGLHYLHEGANHSIIHRDVKSTNILLDEKWVAKVSDFGLSKVGPTGMSRTHVSTVVKGSLGYLDPEYYKRQRLTLKSDVYSFGVVLLEVLCARPPLLRNVDKRKVSLVDWVRRCYDQGEFDQTVDPFLEGTISPECLKSYGQMALSCLHDDGNQRPSMSDVVGALEFALQLEECEEENNKFGRPKGKSEEKPLLPQLMDDERSDVCFTSSYEVGSKSSKVTTISTSSEEQPLSALIFSEIGNPRAR